MTPRSARTISASPKREGDQTDVQLGQAAWQAARQATGADPRNLATSPRNRGISVSGTAACWRPPARSRDLTRLRGAWPSPTQPATRRCTRALGRRRRRSAPARRRARAAAAPTASRPSSRVDCAHESSRPGRHVARGHLDVVPADAAARPSGHRAPRACSSRRTAASARRAWRTTSRRRALPPTRRRRISSATWTPAPSTQRLPAAGPPQRQPVRVRRARCRKPA